MYVQIEKPKGDGMKKAIAYCRVSTEGQAVDGVSLDAQRGKISAWAELNGFELVAVEVDAGLSGGRADNRPGLQNALQLACKEKAALVVYSLSRLARSTKDAISISERLDKSGADLVSLSERIDTTSAAGKMIFRLMAVMAEFERDQISERTSCALQHKKSKNERVGTIPLGFKLSPDGVTLERSETEAPAIQVILKLHSAGKSLRKIRAELEKRNVRNRAGNTKWRLDTLNAIIKRESAA